MSTQPARYNKKILIAAAHPDDEVLGCGGTIKRYSKDNEINALFLGKGLKARLEKGRQNGPKIVERHLENCRKAADLLGINKVTNLDLPDNRFDTVALLDIIQQIEKVIKELDPEIIFTHSGKDLNIDHRIAFQAVLTAVRPGIKNKVKELYSFEVPSSTEWAYGKINGEFSPHLFIDITDHIKAKIEALKSYDSEMDQFPHPRSEEAVISNAQRWGYVSGAKYAEAFEIIRILK